jgi:hypothetical protein
MDLYEWQKILICVLIGRLRLSFVLNFCGFSNKSRRLAVWK